MNLIQIYVYTTRTQTRVIFNQCKLYFSQKAMVYSQGSTFKMSKYYYIEYINIQILKKPQRT